MATFHVEPGPIGEPVTRRFPPLVRELAALQVGESRTLSVYLDVCWDEQQQRRRTWLELRDQLRRLRAEEPRLLTDLERATTWIAERASERANGNGTCGMALFLCGERGIERAIRTAVPLPSLALVAPSPSLRPLVAALARVQPALCVSTDNRATRVWELSLDGDDDVAALVSDVPRRLHSGGWSQLKLQHWRAVEVNRHHGETAAVIEQWLSGPGTQRVLLAGRSDALAGTLRQLGPAARRCVTVAGEFAPGLHEPEMIAAFREALERALRDEALRIIGGLDEWPAGRASGVSAVVAAAAARRMETLVMSETLCAQAARCRRCDLIAQDAGGSCDLCGGERDPIELGEALVEAAVRQDAQVYQLAGPSELDRHQGVVARLRF